METACQASYPLNSENASPPGTFTVYLSWAAWADMAPPPKALTSAVTIAIVHVRLLFITRSSFVKLGVWYWMESRARPPQGSNASQALRTRSSRRTNRGSPRRFARNGSYSESHGKLMKPNSTARSQQSIAASRSFTSAKQSASHQEKISSHCAAIDCCERAVEF